MTTDAIKRLAAANPARGLCAADEHALFERITLSLGDPQLLEAPTSSRGRRRSSPARRRALLVACALGVASIAVAVSLTRSQESAAAAVLHRAAERLASTPRSILPQGSYWYIRTREESGGVTGFRIDGHDRTSFAIESRINETWLANDGSGANYGTRLSRTALTAAGRRALRELEQTETNQPAANGMLLEGPKLIAVPFGNQALTPANLSALPDNETALRLLLEASHGGTSRDATKKDIAAAEFGQVSNALFYEPFDPKVGSALYHMLATIPGVQNLGQAHDALGRPGIELAVDGTTTRQTLLIDPTTGQVLERSQIKIASDAQDNQVPVGSTTTRQTIITTSIVPGTAIRPDGTHLDTSRWTTCKPRPNQTDDLGAAHCTDPA